MNNFMNKSKVVIKSGHGNTDQKVEGYEAQLVGGSG